MNRLIIVGNGFDLAFGLPTKYEDFLAWYFNEKVIPSLNDLLHYSDGLWDFNNSAMMQFSECNSQNLKIAYHNIRNCSRWSDSSNIDSILLLKLFENDNQDWADVESCYFKALISLSRNSENRSRVEKLNRELYALQELLMEYLKTIDTTSPEDSVIHYSWLTKNIDKELIHLTHLASNSIGSYNLENFLIVNFNYTKAAIGIKSSIESEGFNCEMVHIHGKLSGNGEQIIFGYGDETDTNFQLLKDLNDDVYLQHFKSYKYSKDRNLRKILKFIDNEVYDVHVIGHSCALSDRVLLSSIFDNEYCISIVPYIRRDVNNYFSLQAGISRHIKNMDDYRRKIMIEPECPKFSS